MGKDISGNRRCLRTTCQTQAQEEARPCKWAGSRIHVSAVREDTRLRIDIDDDGAGIAPEDRPNLLQRGRRGDEKVAGSGLGLSIVDELASLYGGHLELLDSPLGGLRVSLELPD